MNHFSATAHCAGTIGSKTYGVAKAVTIESYKVLDSNLVGSWSFIIAALNAIEALAISNPLKKYVVSMSLGGPINPYGNEVVERAVKAGVVVVVSAGNENTNACKRS